MEANETTVSGHGKVVEASGNVKMIYTMDNKDVIETFSKEALYQETNQTGTLKGSPRAFWKQGIGKLSTKLKANEMVLNIKDKELHATGEVFVNQSSNTLSADEIIFNSAQNKFTTLGQRPEFYVEDEKYRGKIMSDSIVAWTDKKQIYFLGKVRGTIFIDDNKGKK